MIGFEVVRSLSGAEGLWKSAFEVAHVNIVVLGCLALCVPPSKGIFSRGLGSEVRFRSYTLHDMIGFEVVTTFWGEQTLLESVFEVAHVKIVVLGCFALCDPPPRGFCL